MSLGSRASLFVMCATLEGILQTPLKKTDPLAVLQSSTGDQLG